MSDKKNNEKKTIMIYIENEMFDKIDDYRFAKRFDSRNKAIIDLLEAGLEAKKEK